MDKRADVRNVFRSVPMPLLLLLTGACSTEALESDAIETTASAIPGACTNPLTCPGTPPGGMTIDPNPDDCDSVRGSLTASKTVIPYGSSVVLSWQVSGLTKGCTQPLTLAGQPIGTTGSWTKKPLADSSYLLALGPRALQPSVQVKVELPRTVRITSNTAEWQGLFVQAIGTSGTLVLLKHDLELKLDHRAELRIADGVTIAGEAPPAGTSTFFAPPTALNNYALARDSNHYGPRIFTNTLVDKPLFFLDDQSDNVKLRGFRLQGPDLGISNRLGSGIDIRGARGIEIERLEVSGFGNTGIGVQNKGNESEPMTEDDVWIHDSFIHNNQHAPGGFGYGVAVGQGGKARIEHNVFDNNRHSVASDSARGSGYGAYENLVLRGGGIHENKTTGLRWYTHAFDVHGSQNCWVFDWVLDIDALWNCGPAGEQYTLYRNAFQYQAGNAFKLRGTPSVGAAVVSNVFAHQSEGDAVEQSETGMTLTGNVSNLDTFGKYGVCDFDGDGYDDLFLATGRSFWFASSARFHWTFLSSKDDQLANLGFGDFDHDGRCDVFRSDSSAGWQISSGGKGAWATLPGANYFPFGELAFHDFDGDGYTDIFRREPGTGLWYSYSGVTGVPTLLGQSGVPFESLRFGDFDGDGITDIVTDSGGTWRWSRSGTSLWDPLNDRYGSLSGAIIGNFDGVRGDDVAFLKPVVDSDVPDPALANKGMSLEVSSGGNAKLKTLVRHSYKVFKTPTNNSEYYPEEMYYYEPFFFHGQFSPGNKTSLLAIDAYDRIPKIYTSGQKENGFVQHSFYQY